MLIGLLLVVANGHSQTNRTLEVYPVVGEDPTAWEEVARELVGADGRVIPDQRGSRLLIITTPATHARLHDALQQASSSGKNVQLSVRIAQSDDTQASGASVEGSITSGSDGTTWRLQPRISHQTQQETRTTRQMLVTRSGSEASLRVGTQIPYLAWTMEHARHHPLITTETRWQDVGAFLVFRPVVLPDGETIQIHLVPEIRGRKKNEPASIRFAALETTVTVRNQQTVAIADWQDAGSIYDQFLIGARRKTRKQALRVEITPRILDLTN